MQFAVQERRMRHQPIGSLAGGSQAARRRKNQGNFETGGPNSSGEQSADWPTRIDDARCELKSVYLRIMN